MAEQRSIMALQTGLKVECELAWAVCFGISLPDAGGPPSTERCSAEGAGHSVTQQVPFTASRLCVFRSQSLPWWIGGTWLGKLWGMKRS